MEHNKLENVGYQNGIPLKNKKADSRLNTRVRLGLRMDGNGLKLDRWSSQLFDCLDPWPNGFCAFCTPCVSLAHFTARMGYLNCYTMLLLQTLLYGGLYTCLYFFLASTEVITITKERHVEKYPNSTFYAPYYTIDVNSDYLLYAMIPMVCIAWSITYLRVQFRQHLSIPGVLSEDCIYACCCPFCTIAQMAHHAQSYEKHSCSLFPPPTLPGYTLNTNSVNEEPNSNLNQPLL